MGREDQIEERTVVLESIFPDEITDISETEYRISIKLDITDDNGEETTEPPTLILYVRYPEDYPDEAPFLDLSPPQNAALYPHFSVAADKEQLLKGLEDIIQDNLGIPMIFTLVATLKEEAEQLIADRKAAAAKVKEEVLLAAEREENKKFHGTPVTPETFMKWREGFLKEMEEKAQQEEDERLAELKKARVKEPVKLSGRQLWERGLVGKVDEGDDDEGIPPEQLENLKIAA
ncbi:RWD-domain-containing protein [Annulohypoxylon bovei var. microspora]|nr:RWD-domain-containing protein [Annulohypoxylon bovei var. microspora]